MSFKKIQGLYMVSGLCFGCVFTKLPSQASYKLENGQCVTAYFLQLSEILSSFSQARSIFQYSEELYLIT